MGVEATAVARVLGIDTIPKNLRGASAVRLPQRVALIGQGASAAVYALDPVTVTSAQLVGETYGFGSPLHLAALMLQPSNGDGLGTIPLTVYPLESDPAAGAASAGDVTPAGTHVGAAAYRVVINGIKSAPFAIVDGEAAAVLKVRIAAAVNANVNMPMIAAEGVGSDVTLDAKWWGTSSNDLMITVEGPSQGITFAFTQPVGGLVNPDVTVATALIVDVWETLVVNCLEASDDTALDAYQTFAEGRWGELTHKPLVVFTGTSDTAAANAAISDARPTDRGNAFASAYGSVALPLQIAARAVARIAVRANGDPPRDYAGQALTGIPAGVDSAQEFYAALDASVVAGASTSRVTDGVVVMLDTVTFHHPVGQDPPAYRYVVDVVKLQNIIFNLSLIFASDDWNGAPLIPDEQVTTNPSARSPKDAVAAVNALLDELGAAAIISDPKTAKEATAAAIDGGNPKRLNVDVTVQVSGNANVISVDFNFGFFFGN